MRSSGVISDAAAISSAVGPPGASATTGPARNDPRLGAQNVGRLAYQPLQIAAPGCIGRRLGGERKPHVVGLAHSTSLRAGKRQMEAGGRVLRPGFEDLTEDADGFGHHHPVIGPDDRLAQHRQHFGIAAGKRSRLPQRVGGLAIALQDYVGPAEQEPAIEIVGLTLQSSREPLDRFVKRRHRRLRGDRALDLGEGATRQPRRAEACVDTGGKGRDAKTESQHRGASLPDAGCARPRIGCLGNIGRFRNLRCVTPPRCAQHAPLDFGASRADLFLAHQAAGAVALQFAKLIAGKR